MGSTAQRFCAVALLPGLLLLSFVPVSPGALASPAPATISPAGSQAHVPGSPDGARCPIQASGTVTGTSAYLPFIQRNQKACVPAGQEIAPGDYLGGVRCCAGLSEMAPGRIRHPCDTPGKEGCNWDKCTVDPPCFCFQCSPCGNGICEPQYGENACNCHDCSRRADRPAPLHSGCKRIQPLPARGMRPRAGHQSGAPGSGPGEVSISGLRPSLT